MQPFDFATAAFADLQERLQGLRLTVLTAWRNHGPGTTREVALKAGIDICSFRPRSTELFQLGLLVLVEERPDNGSTSQPSSTTAQPHEGTYRALRDHEIHAAFVRHQESARDAQLVLKL